jgi:hypothetical protein
MNEIVLDGPLAQTRGVIGRYPEADERYVFDFDQTKPRPIHMLGVRRPLLVRWLVDGELIAEQTLRPWIGHARHRADTVTEERP